MKREAAQTTSHHRTDHQQKFERYSAPGTCNIPANGKGQSMRNCGVSADHPLRKIQGLASMLPRNVGRQRACSPLVSVTSVSSLTSFAPFPSLPRALAGSFSFSYSKVWWALQTAGERDNISFFTSSNADWDHSVKAILMHHRFSPMSVHLPYSLQ